MAGRVAARVEQARAGQEGRPAGPGRPDDLDVHLGPGAAGRDWPLRSLLCLLLSVAADANDAFLCLLSVAVAGAGAAAAAAVCKRIFLVFVFVMMAANKPARPTRLLVVDGRGPRRAARVVAEGGPADAQQLAQLLGPLPAEEESEKWSAPCGRRAFRRA